MEQTGKPLEDFWDALLSRRPKRVRAAFLSLDDSSQKNVLAHLRIMVSEAGWQPEQRTSARIALRTLESQVQQDG